MPYFQAPDGTLHFLSPEDIANGGMDLLPRASSELSDEAAAVALAALRTPITPQSVTRRQAMLALLSAGLLGSIEQLMQSAPDTVRVTWETASTFERNNPLITSIGLQLGLTDEAIDALFVAASQL